MNFDERVYCLLNPFRDWSPAGFGVRLLDRADYLVGVYLFWNGVGSPKRFLDDVVRVFGDARLYSLDKNCPPALVCKMSLDVPNLIVLDEAFHNYRKLRVDLLEMRASNPRVFLSLSYDLNQRRWNHKPLLALRCVDSNYSYIPN
jgi:hypothetical protein